MNTGHTLGCLYLRNGVTQFSEPSLGFQDQSILGSGAFADFAGCSASSPIMALTLRAIVHPIQFTGVFSSPVAEKEPRSLAG